MSAATGQRMSDAAAATTGGSVSRGAIWNLVAAVVPQAYTLAVSIVAARVLGPNDMGRQSFIGFIVVVLSMLLTAGFPVALSRFVAERLGEGRPEALEWLVRRVGLIELAASLLAAAVLVAFAVAGAEPRAAWIFAAVACAARILQKIPGSVLVGVQSWRPASVAGLVTGLVSTVATIVALYAGGGISGMLAVQAAVASVTVVWTGIYAWRRLAAAGAGATPDRELSRKVTRYALVASAGVPVTLIVALRSEFFFLDRYSSDAEIAVYSIAFSAYTATLLIPQMLATTLAPAFATLFGAGETRRMRTGYERATRVLTTLTLPLMAGAMAVGPATLRLAYGASYKGSGEVLVVMLALLPLAPALHLSYALLHGLGKQAAALTIGAAAAVVTLVADYFLVRRYDAVGAALGNNAGQLALVLPVVAYASRQAGGLGVTLTSLWKAAVGAAACGLSAYACVALLGDAAGVPLGVVAGSAAFWLAAVATRLLRADDAAWLETIATSPLLRVLVALARPWVARPRGAGA